MLLSVLAVACGSRPSLPAGLPPPEYEEPRVTPWPPPSVERSAQRAAAADDAEPAANDNEAPAPAAGGAAPTTPPLAPPANPGSQAPADEAQ